MKTDLEWFRTFKTVFETGTMSDAARELNISQPGVSLHLNALEAYIGHPLFDRSSRKMMPNERAKLLYQRIIGSLTKLEEVEESFRKKSQKDRLTVSIGMYPVLFSQILEEHIGDLGFNVVLQLGENEQLLKLLESGAIDISITTQETPLRNITYQQLGKSQFVLVAGKGTDVEAFRQLDFENKKQVCKWLLSQYWYHTLDKEILERFWKLQFRKEPDFAPNYLLPDKRSIIRCLRKGPGVALLPYAICCESIAEGSISLLWEGYTKLENTLYIGQRKHTFLQEEIEKIKQIVIAEFAKTHQELSDAIERIHHS